MLFADQVSADQQLTDPSLADRVPDPRQGVSRSPRARRSLYFFLTLILVALTVSQSGCMLVPDMKSKPQYHNPFPQISRVAILPFRNQSQEPTLSGSRVSLAYYDELQSIPGFEVLPTGLVETQWTAFETNVLRRPAATAEDFQRFARYLGVDAVLQGAITDYDAYYPPRMTLKVNWYAANPGFHPIPAGYGLPWGTKHEKKIPQWIRLEAERALAREQLKTQTPDDSEEDSEEETNDPPAESIAPPPVLPNDPFLKPNGNSNGDDRDPNSPSNAPMPTDLPTETDSGSANPGSPIPPVGSGVAEDPNVTTVSATIRRKASVTPQSKTTQSKTTQSNPSLPKSATRSTPIPVVHEKDSVAGWTKAGTQFGPVRLKPIQQTLRPLSANELDNSPSAADGAPDVVTPEILVQNQYIQDRQSEDMSNNFIEDYAEQETLPTPNRSQRSLVVPSNIPVEEAPIDAEALQATQADESTWSNDSELPDEWPDPKGFIPAKPKRNKPRMIAQYEPIISHMKAYNGSNEDFTESLGEYFYFRDDARFGGWQAYLQRSEDFIRFCCHLHVRETLAARGGELESRMILRWPIGRYER